MSNVVELKTEPPISYASRRVMHLIQSGYLPKELKADLEVLLHAAISWQVYKGSLSPEQTP